MKIRHSFFARYIVLILLLTVINTVQAQLKSVNDVGEQLFYTYSFDPNNIDTLDINNGGIFYNNFNRLHFSEDSIWKITNADYNKWDTTLKDTNRFRYYNFNGYGLVTDTLPLITGPLKSSFTFKWDKPEWSNCFAGWSFVLYHNYHFINAGAYIEVSYDHGQSWINMVNDPYIWVSEEFYGELQNEEKGLIDSSIWILSHGGQDFIDEVAAKKYSLWLKFNYESFNNTPHKGWAIDSMVISVAYGCEFLGIEEDNALNAKLYPNPVNQNSVLEFDNPNNQEFILQLYDVLGNKLYETFICESKHQLPYSLFTTGYYVYQLSNQSGEVVTGKFMVE